MMSRLRTANLIALLLPLALLAGAWGSQLIGGLIPCEMCHWQRLPHYAAVVIAVLALMVRRGGGRARRLAGDGGGRVARGGEGHGPRAGRASG